ncbi:MAG: hypothetical protein Q8M88_11105 [Phenylobacterium sp.]|uniref:hypothetical protein n=1 Tax=Phenylobacterium sp. TaxID=1871053 RepID=UPI0027358A27|nr:hypothetical protein [Phenylobacterium sp.]MDP3174968.1 hypothetical protein [Phenylobacterium sp.]
MAALFQSTLALCAVIAAALGLAALAVLLQRRRAGRARGVSDDNVIAPLVRRFEEEQLARMEADGFPMWRPDPEKLKRMTTVRD